MLLTLLIVGSTASVLLKFKKNLKKPPTKKIKSQKYTHLPSTVEKEATIQQKVALGAVGLFTLGTLTSPIIGLLGLPLLAYNYAHMMRQSYDAYQKKSNFTLMVYDTVSTTITLLLGYFFITAILFSLLFTASRLIARTEREAHTDFSSIFGELSDTVWLLCDGVEVEVPLESIQAQDIIIIHTGEMIPVDGQVVSGEGLVDQHLLTGESQPIEKKKGCEVLTSTLVVSGRLHILVEKCGTETITGQIAETLEHTATFKHKVQSRGNRLVEKGAIYTMLATVISTPILGLRHAMALTYSGFGYQMRMAAPLMLLNYLRIASRNGIFIKDGRALDVLHKVDTVVFDKTGTLTEEIPQIGRVIAYQDFDETQILQYAASAEQHQSHPIALAICQYADTQSIEILALINTDYAIGHGLKVDLDDYKKNKQSQHIMIGSERFMRNAEVSMPASITNIQKQAGEKGYSIVYVASKDHVLIGAIELRPTIRPQAQATIDKLHSMNITTYIISGDQEKPTRYLANKLGIHHYFAETLPTDKAHHIEDLQSQGKTVCFIGDGINDSVALQRANIAVSLHGAATIAQDTAEIVLMTPDLRHLPYLINMSTELQQRMDRSELLNTASSAVSVSGVFFLGMGVPAAILLYISSYSLNVFNAMLPLITHPDKPNHNNMENK